jgi:proline iminopeptidase
VFSALLPFILGFTAIGQAKPGTPAPAPPVSASAAPESEGYFTGADGVRLFYRRIGRGKVETVFLHGGPGINMHDGDCYFESLAEDRTIIMYDQRGGGRSQLVSDAKLLTAAHHVRDLEALRRHFGIERMDVIGLSWGTGLAALYAAEYPQRVRRMLLVAPMPVARTPFAAERRTAVDAARGGAARARLNEISQLMPRASDAEISALCREGYTIGARAYLVDPAHWGRERCDRCDAPPASIRNRAVVARATLDSIGDWDFRPFLRKLTMPALVVEGAETTVPLDSTRAWASELINARLLLIKNAGHLFPVDQPAVFDDAIRRFLRGEFPPDAQVVQKSQVLQR